MPLPCALPIGFMILMPPTRLNSSTNMAYSFGHIGIASCWEIVFHFVLISVVCVSLKKKIILCVQAKDGRRDADYRLEYKRRIVRTWRCIVAQRMKPRVARTVCRLADVYDRYANR